MEKILDWIKIALVSILTIIASVFLVFFIIFTKEDEPKPKLWDLTFNCALYNEEKTCVPDEYSFLIIDEPGFEDYQFKRVSDYWEIRERIEEDKIYELASFQLEKDFVLENIIF